MARSIEEVLQKPSTGLLAAPLWRREPYRVLFPLGFVLAWWGVGHWLLLSLGITESYRSIFHSMAQVQGFLTCFALGFLLTFIPRRTGTAPPSAALMVLCVVCPVLTTALAFFEVWAVSQVPWLLLLVVLTVFAARRALSGGGARRVPPSFVWVPLALALSFVATVVTGVAAAAGPDWMWLHDVARGAILQGTFVGLVLGIGGLLMPALTHGEPPPPLAPAQARTQRLFHLPGAVAFAGSYAVEGAGYLAAGYALRAFVALCVLVLSARLYRWPTEPGVHRKLAWVAAWCIPLGFSLVAALPGYKQAGLHLVFIGGFALLTLAVSTHVVLSHGGHAVPLRGRPWQVLALGGLIALAVLFRLLVVFDQVRFNLWIGLASGSFLLATVAWATLLARPLWPVPQRRPLDEEELRRQATRSGPSPGGASDHPPEAEEHC